MINHVMYLSHNFLCAYFSLTKKKKKKEKKKKKKKRERERNIFREGF